LHIRFLGIELAEVGENEKNEGDIRRIYLEAFNALFCDTHGRI
jgi:hypothetical protein